MIDLWIINIENKRETGVIRWYYFHQITHSKIELNNHFLVKSLHHNDLSVLYSLIDYTNSLRFYPQPPGHHMKSNCNRSDIMGKWPAVWCQ